MRILFLPKYSRFAASTRQRFLQYLPILERDGIECEVSPLLDEKYWDKKSVTGRTPVRETLSAYRRRLGVLGTVRRFDLVVLHCEALPYLPPFWERALVGLGVRYVFDFDDAIHHNYDQHPSAAVRWLLAGKIRQVIRWSSGVSAGNRYLADYARPFSRRVEILPTVVDLARFCPTRSPVQKGSRIVVGWIGSPSTAPYLSLIAGPLARFCARQEARVVAVGSGPISLPGVPLETRPWSEAAETDDIRGFDIGIMPLPDTPWARGKSAFKLIQYMACGLPVVASPVGANAEVVENGVSGILADGGDQWLDALCRLAGDGDLREEMGRRGRARVEACYCLNVMAPKFLAFVREAASGGLIAGRSD